jgi:cysteine desulfurase
MIYLDYSANTPADKRVIERYVSLEGNYCGNYNSAHTAGKAVKDEMAAITSSTAALLGVLPEEIVYTSGASEANNLAIKGIARAMRHKGKHIISTPLEHSSVSAPLTWLQEQGYEIDLLNILPNGQADTEQLKELMRKDTILVAVTAVDSELGVRQPVEKIAEIVHSRPDCLLHIDGTQAVGKCDLPLQCADTFSLTQHKFYGLNGSGLLYKKKGVVLDPLIHGGASDSLYRSGTPTLALNGALNTALTLALQEKDERVKKVENYNITLRDALKNYPKVKINSPLTAVPHILNVSVQGVKGRDFQQALSEKGVCVSVKSACSVDNLPSRAVFAVSRDKKNALSSWRISLSHLTTKKEIEEFLQIFDEIYEEVTK